MNFDALLATPGIIPVLVIDDAEDAVALAGALMDGGLRVLEVTLRTPTAAESIARMKAAFPEAVVGAGTVLTGRDIVAARAAGADFLVSPGAPSELLDAVRDTTLPFMPGIATVTEAMVALARGFSTQKLFPAKLSGGPAYVESIGAVLPDIRFMPTGGIGPREAADYLTLPNVVAVGGTWIAPAALIAAKRWDAIRGRAEDALKLLQDPPC